MENIEEIKEVEKVLKEYQYTIKHVLSKDKEWNLSELDLDLIEEVVILYYSIYPYVDKKILVNRTDLDSICVELISTLRPVILELSTKRIKKILLRNEIEINTELVPIRRLGNGSLLADKKPSRVNHNRGKLLVLCFNREQYREDG